MRRVPRKIDVEDGAGKFVAKAAGRGVEEKFGVFVGEVSADEWPRVVF